MSKFCAPLFALLVTFLLVMSPRTAGAQVRPREPIGPFAADARVAWPRFGEDASVAAAIGVSSDNLPSGGLGLAGGVHFYPLRGQRVTLGLGGELLISRGRNAPDTEDTASAAPSVVTRFTALSPQISLNFGSGRGWSYLSGGIGLAGFTIEREEAPVGDAPGRVRALNYGGGARWFARRHVALALDLRFYRIGVQEAAPRRPAYGARRMLVLSAGVSFK